MIFNMIASGGGASTPRFGIATSNPTSTESNSLSFTNLLGEPQAFCAILIPKGVNIVLKPELSSLKFYITHFLYDGVEISTAVTGNIEYSGQSWYSLDVHGNGYNAEKHAYSFVYSSGTLTLSKDTNIVGDGAFHNLENGQYELLYIY